MVGLVGPGSADFSLGALSAGVGGWLDFGYLLCHLCGVYGLFRVQGLGFWLNLGCLMTNIGCPSINTLNPKPRV